MTKLLLAAIAMVAALLLATRHGAGEAQPHAAATPLVVIGSGTMAPLVAAMARRFEQQRPGVRVEVHDGGSGRGLADVRAGYAQVGMVSRALHGDEQDLRALPIARDGIALVVHAGNPVQSLTHAQVAAIYTGAVDNWKTLGGRDEPIKSIAPASGEHSSPTLIAGHFGLALAQLKASHTEGSNAQRLRLLREHPSAIAFLSVSEAERSVRDGAPLRLLPDQGIAASSRNVLRGDYPLARPLVLVTRPAPGALAQAFIAFCASSQVTDLIVAHDFVPYMD